MNVLGWVCFLLCLLATLGVISNDEYAPMGRILGVILNSLITIYILLTLI